ncbi:hypothetical protein INR49_009316 [Caranx melampygus]|nr:hypothetical protein INR49_009316 [Caranx melampygus]
MTKRFCPSTRRSPTPPPLRAAVCGPVVGVGVDGWEVFPAGTSLHLLTRSLDSLVLLLPADVPLSPTLKLHQSQSDIMKGAGMKTLVFNICGLNHELADGAEDAPVTRLYIRLSTCEITGSLGGLWLERGQGLDPGREKPKSH